MGTIEIILMVLSAGLGLGGIGIKVKEFLSKSEKYFVILDEFMDVIQVAVSSLKDGKLTEEEQQAIAKEVTEAIASLKTKKNEA